MTAHNVPERQTTVPPAGFEPTISAGQWPAEIVGLSLFQTIQRMMMLKLM
jgi:hypothetical protein